MLSPSPAPTICAAGSVISDAGANSLWCYVTHMLITPIAHPYPVFYSVLDTLSARLRNDVGPLAQGVFNSDACRSMMVLAYIVGLQIAISRPVLLVTLIALAKRARDLFTHLSAMMNDSFHVLGGWRPRRRAHRAIFALLVIGLLQLLCFSRTSISHVISPSVDQSDNATANRHIEAISDAIHQASSEATDNGQLRVAVCISGQLSRLEVASKMVNLLKPLAATNPAALDVFLALEVGKPLYTNLDMGAILAQQHAACGASAFTPDSASAAFSPFLATTHFSNHSAPEVNLQQWPNYKEDRPHPERKPRLQRLLSQLAHMRTCGAAGFEPSGPKSSSAGRLLLL